MIACSDCGVAAPEGSRFCPSCGGSLAPDSYDPTRTSMAISARARERSTPADAERFLPGTVLAERYRIYGLLGRGGMGEVYRADDLKLGQSVALKFLPQDFERDEERRSRFLNEVKVARQISHSNVCRVYDVGEVDGRQFISMEYVDGEDLAVLLRRIGHLPKEKAVEIARQLCAGLAAAHEQGVLHRDLKPANVMIDGRGRAKITDFGLAALATDDGNRSAGTPAYMAPEQLAGGPASVRSDLYALGLVLYELFTGKRPFAASTAEELVRLQRESAPTNPSSHVEGFDPAVERTILRCLRADPRERPDRALAVAAALPGGDPLAAALAAGETPSPELVAEAGGNVAVSPAIAWGALAVFFVAVVAVFLLSSRTSLLGIVPLEKPPAALQERAREILVQAGYAKKPADSIFAFEGNAGYLEALRRRDDSGADRWAALRTAPPSGLTFWYRQSPAPLDAFSPGSSGGWMEDPPHTVPGMARVGLDPDGRLVSLLVVPEERSTVDTDHAAPDWDPLLRATGVDVASLAPAEPEWLPPVFADRRAAWTGTWSGKPDLPVRIEAAARGDRPVSLRVVLPWTRPAEEPPPRRGFWNRASLLVGPTMYVAVIIAAGFVALRNVRRGRGDRPHALRFALYCGAVRMLWFLGAHHIASPSEQSVFAAHLAYAMQRVGVAYVFYLAVEPYARRLWPRMLVSWVRILDGGFRDPLVGRDLLIGAAAGALMSMNEHLQLWVPAVLGGPTGLPIYSNWMLEMLRGSVPAFVALAGLHTGGLFELIIPVTLLLIFRLLFRRTAPAVVMVTLIGLLVYFPESGSLAAYAVSVGVGLLIFWTLLFRFGLLAFAVTFFVASILNQTPMSLNVPGWLAGPMLLGLAVAAIPAVWGFWVSRAGRPLFRDEVLERAPVPR